jgi:hypothetical protein
MATEENIKELRFKLEDASIKCSDASTNPPNGTYLNIRDPAKKAI